MSKSFKVAVWGTGMIGQYALRYILGRPELDLVGVLCWSDDKVGKDAAELADGDHPDSGIKVSNDVDAFMALDADVVIYAPKDALADPSIEGSPSSQSVPHIEALLRSGKNVLTPILSFTHWRHLKNGDALRARLEDAAKAGNASLLGAGLDPGYVTDAFAFFASTATGEIDSIDTWEILDYGSYGALDTVRMLGFGARPQDMPPEGLETLKIGWGGALHVLADAFHIELDDIRLDVDVALAKEAYTGQAGLEIAERSIEAMMFRVAGVYKGKDVFGINHVTRIGPQAGPDFRNIGHDGGYAVHIAGYPPINAEFPFGYDEGTGRGWSDAMAMTSARLVNAVESIVDAEPGWRLFFETPRHGGRFALKLR
ncbi:hypothetical protein [Aurantiacibacter rhizosphaerae]|uniref:Dihydrodipicolinate reductase n=1 Tax=Aurantiacibacter rhizosphaerae TaxID=2691582 RepID=A0A844XB96_9SPHN|nr:hypothetical protein [Aurantiacibacter rhizosphaerae]MWV27761.1 hypothetical protein [Aurantiacibacter rhizosphaerae]